MLEISIGALLLISSFCGTAAYFLIKGWQVPSINDVSDEDLDQEDLF